MGINDVCILDNGAYSIKVGWQKQGSPLLVPNCIMKAKSERRRAFIGNQIEECRDASGLYFLLCFQKGYLLNWDIQKTVWDHIFSQECSSINLSEKTLIVTEPHFNFNSIKEAMTEIFFEEYECDAIYRTTTADLAAGNYFHSNLNSQNCCIVIDVGYSFTHIVPFIKGKKHKSAIRRIDIGGKVLTNHLKEIISYRHLNMMDESYVVNQIKEDVCFVSNDFTSDMKKTRSRNENTLALEYVLPDYTAVKRGYIRKPGEKVQDHQTIRLCNERFTIPELLFYPSSVGINETGIPETVINSLEDCSKLYHKALLSNIVVVGGTASLPGMQKRLQREIQSLAPDDIEVSVIVVEKPITYPWHGGKVLANTEEFEKDVVTREMYEEHGTRISIEKFEI